MCCCFNFITVVAALLCVFVNILSFKNSSDIFDGILWCYAVVIVLFVAVEETEWGFIKKFWRNNSKAKNAQGQGGEPSDPGPTTPLLDKKLLVFILDRLHKKDTYEVFSEPEDPEELPDYHEIIEHPMDFGTVRKKLSGGAYSRLEQFEVGDYILFG